MSTTTLQIIIVVLGVASVVLVVMLGHTIGIIDKYRRVTEAASATTVEDLDFVGTDLLVKAVLLRHDRAAFVGVVLGAKTDRGQEITTRWNGLCKCGSCRDAGFGKPQIANFVNELLMYEMTSQRVDLPPDQRLDQHKDPS